MNYKVEKRGQIGRTEMILVNKDETISGVADGRGDDSLGVE